MNYDQFRAWRSDLLRARSPRRLDCMNPEMALAHLRPEIQPKDASIDEAVAAFSAAAGVDVPEPERVVGSGIRPLLHGLFAALASRIDRLWLPDDVYPVYWELSSPLAQRGFATLPDVDWRFLDDTGARDALLLPHPLSPLGRPLSPHELRRLTSWLQAGRCLILDRAYGLEAELPGAISLWSMSKPWLSRGLFAIARVPPDLRDDVQARVPLPSQPGRAVALLSRPLPQLVSERFVRAWTSLAPAIRAAAPSWRPPATGYFSVVPLPFDELLSQHDLLAVPASVFGSRRADLSIASCLYQIELEDREA